ncbi:MAG: dTMP kinase [Chloroflexi bacterium]|nr:dTMP kinase [Chloroflexota bacterium]
MSPEATSKFITFEGGEGAGKTTQCQALLKRLRQRGMVVLLTKEPGGTPFGHGIRMWLKGTRRERIVPEAELFLFLASRAQLASQVIRPALLRGEVVICDRYTESTYAYQGYGRGIDREAIGIMNKVATEGLSSDLVVLLDVPPELGLTRTGNDYFQREGLEFHRRVRQGYLDMAAREGERWLVVDAALPPGEVSEIVWGRVRRMLEGKGG